MSDLLLLGRNPDAFSVNDKNHISIWLNDPQWVADAKQFAPNGGTVIWTITGGFRLWGGDGTPPTHASSLGDLIPVVAIKF